MRVLVHPLLSMQDLKLDITEHPCILSLWREVPRWKSLPEIGFPKAPLWCQQLTRGVCNNIVDILVRVWGSGVRFWTPLLAGKSLILCEEHRVHGLFSIVRCHPGKPGLWPPKHASLSSKQMGGPYSHSDRTVGSSLPSPIQRTRGTTWHGNSGLLRLHLRHRRLHCCLPSELCNPPSRFWTA